MEKRADVLFSNSGSTPALVAGTRRYCPLLIRSVVVPSDLAFGTKSKRTKESNVKNPTHGNQMSKVEM